MAIALVTHAAPGIGFQGVNAGHVIPPGRLLLIYAHRRVDDATLPTAPAGWRTVFSQLPYEGNKNGTALFSKMSDGGQDTGGVDGIVGLFGPGAASLELMLSEWSGAGSAIESALTQGAAQVFGAGASPVSKTIAVPAGGLLFHAAVDRDFGADNLVAAGASIQLDQFVQNFAAVTVYRLNGGATGNLTSDITDTGTGARWSQDAAAAFAPPSGGAFTGEPGGGLWSG